MRLSDEQINPSKYRFFFCDGCNDGKAIRKQDVCTDEVGCCSCYASPMKPISFAEYRRIKSTPSYDDLTKQLRDLRAKLTTEVERLQSAVALNKLPATEFNDGKVYAYDDAATRLEAIVKGEPHAH